MARRQQQYNIEVEATELIQLSADEFEGRITAIVKKGRHSVKRKPVQFFINGVATPSPLQTDDNGRVSDDINITTAARNLCLEAQLVGYAARAKKIIALPRTKKKEVVKIDILTTTRKQNAVIVALIRLDDSGNGIAGKVLVIDPDESLPIEKDTNNGLLVVELEIGTSKREVAFFASEKPGVKTTIKIMPAAIPTIPVTPTITPSTKVQPTNLKSKFMEGFRRGRKS